MKHTIPIVFPTQVPKLLKAGAAGRPAGPGWPGAPSLTLSRQLTFSVGYTTFPQRAHWGFIVAAPAGGGCCCGGGCELRGAAVTSPGEPCAASGQAEGLRARTRWAGGVQGGAAGPGAGRTRRRWRAGVRLGLRAAGSASPALQVPVTHKHSRPPLALAHSLPRRRRRAGQTHQCAPAQGAEDQPVWHQGTEGGAGVGRTGEAKELGCPRTAARGGLGSRHPRRRRPRAPRWAAATEPAGAEEVRAGGDRSPGKAGSPLPLSSSRARCPPLAPG